MTLCLTKDLGVLVQESLFKKNQIDIVLVLIKVLLNFSKYLKTNNIKQFLVVRQMGIKSVAEYR